jgi:subtilisin family serine protease
VGTVEYAIPGLGGRAPVRWLGRPPVRSTMDRRPVVAILDTGVADHYWFDAPDTDPIITRFRFDAQTGRVEPADENSGGEPFANLIDPLEGLVDPFFGHGTFIAGLIQQTCPNARVLSIKVMDNDGIVEEAALINALGFLHQQHRNALTSGADADLIDVVSLSLGYYHEAGAAGVLYDTLLRRALSALADLGVLVVAAAGNDATSQPLLPAGFSPYRNGQLLDAESPVPLLSVGALNPDGSVALFSNSGDWVACHSPGAALVSTLPLVDSGQRSGVDTGYSPPGEREVASWRATVDPDSFTGFGTWSGTSFAAPVAAGAAAQAMVTGQERVDPPASQAARAQRALASLGFDLAD